MMVKKRRGIIIRGAGLTSEDENSGTSFRTQGLECQKHWKEDLTRQGPAVGITPMDRWVIR